MSQISQVIVVSLTWNASDNQWETNKAIDFDKYIFIDLIMNDSGNFLVFRKK